MEFFNQFVAGVGTTHADLLTANALVLAARRGVDVEVVKEDESTIAVHRGAVRLVGSDWDNIRSLLMA